MISPEEIPRNVIRMSDDDVFYINNKHFIDGIDHSLAVEELIYPLNTYDNILFEEEEKKKNQHRFFFAFPFEEDYRGTQTDPTFYGTKMGLYKNEFKILDIPFEDGDVVLDLGSNVGAISVVMAKLYPKINVYAFDANPTAYKIIKLNAKLNDTLNLKAFNLAVGLEELDNVDFYTSSNVDTCALVKRDHLDEEKKEKEHSNLVGSVPQVTLESLLDSKFLNISKVKYAKIDIEGAEIPLFEDIFETNADLLKRIEYLHIEVHSSEHYGEGYTERGDKLKEKLKDCFGDKLILQSH
tara:strand:+ start:1618 stop:2505 length:888 start_codon:yes stop_codon:yes gene_type:complete